MGEVVTLAETRLFDPPRVADMTGLTMPLAQHGLDDTVLDTTYNPFGALVIAIFGQAHLTGVAETVRIRIFGEEA